MRKRTATLFLTLTLALAGSGCALPVVNTGSTAASVGPESQDETTPTSDPTPRLDSGCEWLWASYTALKDKVDPALPDMIALYANAQEMVVAIQSGDVVKALQRYVAARALVTEIVEAM